MSVAEVQIPQEIISAYQIDEAAGFDRLTGGLVNQTFKVVTPDGYAVLQGISSELSSDTYRDAAVVASHLYSQGWEVPLLLPADDGSLTVIDQSGKQWRSTAFIASDAEPPAEITSNLVVEAGQLVGRWHRDIRTLDYRPRFGIPHFHETLFYAHKLRGYMADTALDEESAELGKALVSITDTSVTPNGRPQVIHADPKLSNMLYRDGRPITLIDLDTLMHGSIWIDNGDFLRSAIARGISERRKNPLEMIGQFMAGYQEFSGLQIRSGEALQKAKESAVLIAAELGIRYLCDIVDGSYFSWDNEKHTSRRNNHFERAQLQLRVAAMASQATVRDMMGEK